ncbi:hypothetical protein ACVWYQ_001203 [Bradyrhizobium sp. USDA 3397]
MTTLLSFDDWLASMPEIEGVRPLDRLTDGMRPQSYRPTYRRQRPPTDPRNGCRISRSFHSCATAGS